MARIFMNDFMAIKPEEGQFVLISMDNDLESARVARLYIDDDIVGGGVWMDTYDDEFSVNEYPYWTPLELLIPARPEPAPEPKEEFSIPGYKIVNGLVVKV